MLDPTAADDLARPLLDLLLSTGPCFIQRTESHPAFSVFLGDPIVVATDRPRDEAIQQATQQFADQLTARIRRHPEYWYQFYRYWDAQQDSYEGLG